jgi:putative phage-type endonuclease
MKITRDDINEYLKYNYQVKSSSDIYNDFTYLLNDLYNIYNVTNLSEKYVIKHLVNEYIEKCKHINIKEQKLEKLKQLELPEQRSPEWYALRKKCLTASSLASALDKCHFTSRDELIYDKIVEKPYESNPITEWGVKYEDVAIQFYEELYNVKVLDFGLVPHPHFPCFGASPDGICDKGNDEYVARMVEIKCPPKRKFTKSVPEHYWMQMQGQLEVCDLDECDFFQVKLEDYESYDDYCKDIFINENDNTKIEYRTNLNFPKGVTITYKKNDKLSYTYCPFNKSNEWYQEWITKQDQENIFEIKWWRIERYENTLVKRDKEWWSSMIEEILKFSNDLEFYKKSENLEILKQRVEESKKKKRKIVKPLTDFMLVSDEEDN